MNSITDKNTSPYIIASGSTPNSINQYFIVVEKHLINVRVGH